MVLFSLSGNDLAIYTMDLDKVLTTYESTQKFNLIDLGAFFIAGPLGTAGLKGYNYWDVYGQTQAGSGKIVKLIAFWKTKNGIANAVDCALSTPHNRIALFGNLNLVSRRYEDVTVALLDDNGCAKFKQSITGSFTNPKVGAASAIQTLAGPIISLYRKAKRAVQGDNCKVFYNGAVQHP